MRQVECANRPVRGCATDTLTADPTTERAPMPSPSTPQTPDPEDGAGVERPHDQVPAEPSRASRVIRVQTATGGFVARHPALLKVLERMGWNNPGGSMNS